MAILKQGVAAWNKWRKYLPGAWADLRGANLSGMDLVQASLTHTTLIQADLSRADLCLADLRGADITEANLTKADLFRADLRGAKLDYANFGGGNLALASFLSADLFAARLDGSKLSWTNLGGANLRGVDLTGARIGNTFFCDVDLSQVKGLETVRHFAPSTIGIDTIYKSGGNIPESFLRGCGVPEDFIVYMRALVNNPIEYYSLFISYSSKDEGFARRLHADLQAANVRCWFAPHDMVIGDKIRDRIDETIRTRDKVLLILSSNSISSNWVENEVETALEEETRRGKVVLFPIRLDDAVMTTDKAWAAHLRRTRHIGDFTRWKEHDAYQAALARLLRDLKASAQAAG